MLDPQLPLRVAGPNVHSKVFDDEVIVLDMTSGTYFSLRGGATDVWALVQSQVTTAEIVRALAGRYDAPPDAIAAAAHQCLGELVEAGLVVTDPGVGRATPPVGAAPGGRAPFPAPEIERFTDMRELLLLDPIHEVDDTGWPNAPHRS